METENLALTALTVKKHQKNKDANKQLKDICKETAERSEIK